MRFKKLNSKLSNTYWNFVLKITLYVNILWRRLFQKVTKSAFEMKTVLKLGRKKRVKLLHCQIQTDFTGPKLSIVHWSLVNTTLMITKNTICLISNKYKFIISTKILMQILYHLKWVLHECTCYKYNLNT